MVIPCNFHGPFDQPPFVTRSSRKACIDSAGSSFDHVLGTLQPRFLSLLGDSTTPGLKWLCQTFRKIGLYEVQSKSGKAWKRKFNKEKECGRFLFPCLSIPSLSFPFPLPFLSFSLSFCSFPFAPSLLLLPFCLLFLLPFLFLFLFVFMFLFLFLLPSLLFVLFLSCSMRTAQKDTELLDADPFEIPRGDSAKECARSAQGATSAQKACS